MRMPRAARFTTLTVSTISCPACSATLRTPSGSSPSLLLLAVGMDIVAGQGEVSEPTLLPVDI